MASNQGPHQSRGIAVRLLFLGGPMLFGRRGRQKKKSDKFWVVKTGKQQGIPFWLCQTILSYSYEDVDTFCLNIPITISSLVVYLFWKFYTFLRKEVNISIYPNITNLQSKGKTFYCNFFSSRISAPYFPTTSNILSYIHKKQTNTPILSCTYTIYTYIDCSSVSLWGHEYHIVRVKCEGCKPHAGFKKKTHIVA